MLDDDAPQSPLGLVETLEKELAGRQVTLQRLQDYHDGKHRLAFTSQKFREAFGGMFASFADNWCQLVVDAVEERLNVEGFRNGSDPTADKDAWRIWQANGLDADSQLAHSEALIKGDSFAIVWGDADGNPKVSIESPRDVIVAYKPGDRKCRLAALKRWRDDDGVHATLFTPDFVYKYEKEDSANGKWEPDMDDNEPWPLPNPLGVVPVVQLSNRASLTSTYGVSEFLNVIPQQDAVNKLLADMMIASEYIAFPQRYVTGLEIPVDENTGREKAPFQIALDKLLIAEDPNARFGTLSAGDLGNYVTGIETLVQHIASQTRTPPHYFYLGGNFPSGDAIKSAETGLVAKSRRKMRFFGEAWEEVIRLCFKVQGDPRGDITDSEVIWGDPEYRSEAELADALVKRSAIGVPRQQLWEDAGYSQTQIARFKAMEAEDSLNGLLGLPPVPPVTPPAA
jgi:Phage portal protein, SPP1 Gp6-like